MLPFLKQRRDAGLIVQTRKPDEKPSESEDMGDPVEACAEDLINAIHAKDVRRAAEAMRAAFEIMDAEPHVEGPHESEEEI